MKPQHLIQAFSRTNRLFDKSKRYGQVVTMQTPSLYAKLIDDALVLYCNGGTNDVAAPTWSETKQKFSKALAELRKIAATPEAAIKLTGKDELAKFAKAFQAVDRYFSELQVYDEFKEEDLKAIFEFDREEFERLTGIYKNVIEQLKTETEQEPQPIGIDIEYELESVKTVEIDYRYLLSLIQSHMPTDSDTIGTITDAEDQRISSYIEQFSKDNPQIGQILRQIRLELKFNPESYRNKDAFTIVQERVREVVDKTVADFAAKWRDTGSEKKRLKTPVALNHENEIVSRTLQYVADHVCDKLSVEIVSREVGVSASHLTALFHRQMNISPGEYIRRVKLEESKRLIREGTMNFSQIAAQLNYSTIHHFSRQFKDKFGMSPSEYAKSIQSE